MLIINELKYLFRQPIVWVCLLIAPSFAFSLSAGLATSNVDPLQQYQLHLVSLHMMQLVLLVGALSPAIFLRDHLFHMDEIIAVASVSSRQKNYVRIGGFVSLLMMISLSSTLVMSYVHFQNNGFSWQILGYTIFYSSFVLLINCFLLIALAFWLCQRFRSSMIIYAIFASIWIAYVFAASITGNPILAGSNVLNETFYQLFIWLDPFAYTTVIASFSESQNTPFYTNRFIFFTLAFIIFKYVVGSHPQAHAQPKRTKQQCLEPDFRPNTQYQTVKPTFSQSSILFELYKAGILNILKQPITLILLLLWLGLVFNSVASSSQYAEPMSVIKATSIDAVNQYAFDMYILLGCLLVALWSWQLSCNARHYNVAEIIAAAPIKTASILHSQLLAIMSLVFVFSFIGFVGASLAEFFIGSDFDAYHHIYTLALMGLPLAIIASIFVCIFNLMRSELIASIVVFAILLLKFTPVMTYFGLTHTFWSVAWTPLQPANEFWGYRASLSSYWPYVRAWLVLLLSVVLVSQAFNHRGTGMGSRALQNKDVWILTPAVLAISLFWQLHVNLISEKPLSNSHKRETFKANYEKMFADWKHKAQPKVSHIDAEIDFYPYKQSAQFNLTYSFTNSHTKPIKQVLIGRAGFYQWADIKIEGAEQVVFYPSMNQAIYEFKPALQPFETRQLKTQFAVKQAKLWPTQGHQIITPEFSYIRSIPLLPTLGYQRNYELDDEQLRLDYGLPLYVKTPPSKLFNATYQVPDSYERITMKSKVTTAVGYQVVSQGKNIEHIVEGQRAVFKFQTTVPINNLPAWLSFPFGATELIYEGVKLQVFTKSSATEANQDAVKVNLQAMSDTLSWFKNNLNAYKGSKLSLIDATGFGGTGYALPEIMLIDNKVGFRAEPSEVADFDQRYRRAVHETAHQWFGHDIGNSVSEDSAFLIESLAKYIELVVIEKRYGKKAVEALVKYETQRYQQASRLDISTKQALIDSSKSYDQYSKATLVFAKLRNEFGDAVIVAALKSVWQKYAHPNRPATSMDFIRALQEQLNDQDKSLINKLFLEV